MSDPIWYEGWVRLKDADGITIRKALTQPNPETAAPPNEMFQGVHRIIIELYGDDPDDLVIQAYGTNREGVQRVLWNTLALFQQPTLYQVWKDL